MISAKDFLKIVMAATFGTTAILFSVFCSIDCLTREPLLWTKVLLSILAISGTAGMISTLVFIIMNKKGKESK